MTMKKSSPKSKFKVAICGGGISGLALASFLSESEDIAVEVFEAKSEVRAIGAGIAIWRRYWDVLNHTHNLEAECTSRGIALPTWEEKNGPTLRKSDIPDGGYEFFSLGLAPAILPRTVLVDILLGKAKAGRCIIYTNKQLVRYTANADSSVTLHFDNGEYATTDLLVGADGVHSQVRETMFHDNPALARPRFSGQLAYRLKCRQTDLQESMPDHPALSGFRIWCGMGRHVTSNSVGEFIQMTAYDNVDHDPNIPYSDAWEAQVSIDEVYQGYQGWEPELLGLLKSAPDASRWAIHVVKPLPWYIFGNVVLVGDAAHAMTPHIGLGGGQGIEDALVLSQLLMHPLVNGDNVADALTVYDKIRRLESQRVARWSQECGLMYAFLLPEKKGLPLSSLGNEFCLRTDWLREENALAHELQMAKAMLENSFREKEKC